MAIVTPLSDGYVREAGVNTLRGRTYFLVTDIYNVADLADPGILGLPVPGLPYDNMIARSCYPVKIINPVVPMAAIFAVESDVTYVYPAARRTTRLLNDGFDDLIVPHIVSVARNGGGPPIYNTVIEHTPRTRYMRVVERYTGTSYPESFILNFDATNAGKLYTFDGTNFLYLGTEAVIEPTGQTTVTSRFWTNAKVQAVSAGSSGGIDVDLPALNNLERYEVDYSVYPPVVHALSPSTWHATGVAVPWL